MKPGIVELDENYILFSVLLFAWAVYIWENYLTLRQVGVVVVVVDDDDYFFVCSIVVVCE